MPQFFWLLFLKLFDDRQLSDESINPKNYKPVLEYPYRWRDWAFASD
jgi:type I restriction enzyme M protein